MVAMTILRRRSISPEGEDRRGKDVLEQTGVQVVARDTDLNEDEECAERDTDETVDEGAVEC